MEEHETNDSPGRQTALPLGARPGILAEPGPQRSDGSLRHSSVNAPLLVVATLAPTAADGVDAAALAFLTAARWKPGGRKSRRRGRKRKRRRRRRRRRSVVFLAGSSCFQMLRGSAASSSPMKPKLRLHWNVTSPSLRRTSGLLPGVTT